MQTTTATQSSAQICRDNNWQPGQVLIGEPNGPGLVMWGREITPGPKVTIEITAIGERGVLARTIALDGQPHDGGEVLWDLHCRDWTPHPNSKAQV